MRLGEAVSSASIIDIISLKQEEIAKSKRNEDMSREKNSRKGIELKRRNTMEGR